MKIIRPVQIRFIVTDELRRRLLSETRQAQQVLDSRIQHIEVEGRRIVERIQRENVLQAGQVREQIEEEKQQLLQLRRELKARLDEFEGLKLGEEVVHRTEEPVQEIVDISEGDSVLDVLKGSEIVVKDDIIVEFRKARPEAEEPAASATIATPDNPTPGLG